MPDSGGQRTFVALGATIAEDKLTTRYLGVVVTVGG